jgi:hypothetical protein
VQFNQLDENVPIDDIKDITISVQQAYADVIEASAQVREARTADIKTAMNSLSDAVKDISPSMTINEARASIQDELAIVRFATASLNDAVQCSLPTPEPIPTSTPEPSPTPVPTATVSPVSTSQEQVCTDLAAFDAAVAELENLSGDSTLQQVEEAHTAVLASWEQVKVSTAQVPEVKIDNLDQAVQDLDRAVRDIDTSMSFAEAKESISDELQGVQAAREELRTTLSCQPGS